MKIRDLLEEKKAKFYVKLFGKTKDWAFNASDLEDLNDQLGTIRHDSAELEKEVEEAFLFLYKRYGESYEVRIEDQHFDGDKITLRLTFTSQDLDGDSPNTVTGEIFEN